MRVKKFDANKKKKTLPPMYSTECGAVFIFPSQHSNCTTNRYTFDWMYGISLNSMWMWKRYTTQRYNDKCKTHVHVLYYMKMLNIHAREKENEFQSLV